MNNVLAIIGDYYHKADVIERGLKNAFDFTGLNLVIKEDVDSIDWQNISHMNLIILSKAAHIAPRESDEIWMLDEHETLLEQYVANGGNLFMLHSSLAGYPTGGSFRNMVKGHFIHHPAEHPVVKIEPVNSPRPILAGVEPFEITDEQYFVEWDDNSTHTLLSGSSEEFGSSAVAWAHAYGKGRVFCLTPGHTDEVFSHPMMKKLIANGINWCLSQHTET